jgi:hypothetical protein
MIEARLRIDLAVAAAGRPRLGQQVGADLSLREFQREPLEVRLLAAAGERVEVVLQHGAIQRWRFLRHGVREPLRPSRFQKGTR